MADKEIALAIVEDHSFLREALELEFRRAHKRGGRVRIAAAFASCEEAIRALPDIRPDVVMMDITLPGGMDGIAGTRVIKKRWPMMKVVIFSAREEHAQVRAALCAGADSYIDKTVPIEVLHEAVCRVHAGNRSLSLRAADQLIKYHQEQKPTTATLSQQEERVMELVMRGSVDKEIAEMLAISEYTVREYKRRICDKTPGSKTLREAIWARRRL